MAITKPKKRSKMLDSSVQAITEKTQGIACSKCHRLLENGESCNKNIVTGEITCLDCSEDLVLKDNAFLAIE